MAATIRLATERDADQWLELVKAGLGEDYPAKEIYDPAWIASQLVVPSGHETWIAELNGRVMGSACFLKTENPNPIANIGRNLFRSSSFMDGSAEELLEKIVHLSAERGQMTVVRVLAEDNAQQTLLERLDFICVGFQPFKHMLRTRQGVLFYVKPAKPVMVTRLPLSESLPHISELASLVLGQLKLSYPTSVRDGVTGYPLQSDLKIHDATIDDFELWRVQCQSANPQPEISGGFHTGPGFLRLNPTHIPRAILGQRENNIVAGLAYYFDDHDRFVRIVDAFSADDISLGALMQQAVKIAQEQFSSVYVEVDVLMTAPRLLKTAEQLGFVPISYFPAFYARNGNHADVTKMVKLNMAYASEGGAFTGQARAMREIIDHNFQDQKVGVAVINLLRGLPIFQGLGDGELRKIARLFVQKLYRPGEQIFKKGDSGEEAYIVMRGQVDICLDDQLKPIASIGPGKIFGELAFLDGSPRNAYVLANQASILLVMQRAAFNEVVQREPHLGMIVMRNVAVDLSNKLRQANTVISPTRRS